MPIRLDIDVLQHDLASGPASVLNPPARPGDVLRVAAAGAAIGTRNRWMSPSTDGQHIVAVHTPHLGGVLHRYRREGERLTATRLLDGLSNHAIGSHELDVSAWVEGVYGGGHALRVFCG